MFYDYLDLNRKLFHKSIDQKIVCNEIITEIPSEVEKGLPTVVAKQFGKYYSAKAQQHRIMSLNNKAN